MQSASNVLSVDFPFAFNKLCTVWLLMYVHRFFHRVRHVQFISCVSNGPESIYAERNRNMNGTRKKDIAVDVDDDDDKKWSTHNGNKNILNLFFARTHTAQ